MKLALPLLISLWLSLVTSALYAQGIVFETGDWASAVQKARKQKKLLFLHLDKPDCGGCTEVASVAFTSPLIREKFSVNFISFRTDGSTGIGKELAQKVEMDCLPASVYIDPDGFPLARYCGSTSLYLTYLEKAEEALRKSKQQPLNELADAYASGNRSPKLLRTYLERRHDAGLSTYELLDEYVRQLSPDSLQRGTTLRFIFEQGPVVGSYADSVLRRNYVRTDSLYRAVGQSKAIALNQLITNNSLRKAIQEKNIMLAYRTAGFRQRTYQNDHRAGAMAREWVMLRYYRGVQDTASYLPAARHYYDTYFMSVKVDSIQSLDELENRRRMRGVMPAPAGGARPGPGGMMVMAHPNTQRYVSALNQAAWDFYELTPNPYYLNKALEWSKRTLEFREDGSSMDTYAHILYRLGRRQEALDCQERAIKTEQERNSPLLASFQESLRRMKAGTL